MVALGKISQILESRGLAVDRRLRVEFPAVEHEAVFLEVKVIAQCVSEPDFRGVRLDGKRNGPGNPGHAVCSLGEGPRLRPRDFAVLGGDRDRSLTGKHDGCAAA